jgi:hypothetical protein
MIASTVTPITDRMSSADRAMTEVQLFAEDLVVLAQSIARTSEAIDEYRRTRAARRLRRAKEHNP